MKKIPLAQGKVALIDDEDFELVSQYKWYYYKNKNESANYAITKIRTGHKKYQVIKMHRLILGLKTGDKHQCDHIDHNGLNNQKNNLRICTSQQNRFNSRARKNSTSKYKGVCWDKRRRQWVSYIRIQKKLIYLGGFCNEKEAAKIYNRVALFEFGEFAYTNFPKKIYPINDFLSINQAIILRENKKNLSSKFRGVSWDKSTRKWRAQIRMNKKTIYLGIFKNETEAAKAYNLAKANKIN